MFIPIITFLRNRNYVRKNESGVLKPVEYTLPVFRCASSGLVGNPKTITFLTQAFVKHSKVRIFTFFFSSFLT